MQGLNWRQNVDNSYKEFYYHADNVKLGAGEKLETREGCLIFFFKVIVTMVLVGNSLDNVEGG